MSLYRDTGVVLRTYKLGEADRIVVLLTASHGKVRAVAKGVRKTKSRFGARLEPLHHVSLLLYEGRELDIVSQAETVDHFRAAARRPRPPHPGLALLEAVDQLAQEREPDARLYQHAASAPCARWRRSRHRLVVPAFYWKLLALEGVRPRARRLRALRRGARAARGLRPGRGRRAVPDVPAGRAAVSPEALELMRRILGGGLNAALAEAALAGHREVAHLATAALEHHLERRLRAVAMFE